MTKPEPHRPNAIAQLIAFFVMAVIGISFALYLDNEIRKSGNSGRTEIECFKLSEEITNALEDKKIQQSNRKLSKKLELNGLEKKKAY